MIIRKRAAVFVSTLILGSALTYDIPLNINGICANAENEYKEVTSLGVTYRIYNDHAEVTDGKNASGKVFVPMKIGSSTVTSITQDAFRGSDVTEVSMPTVTYISSGAFKGCNKLTDVYFSEKLQTIGADAFADCPKLTAAVLPLSTVSVGLNAFGGDASLKSLTILNSECAIDDRNSTISNKINSDGSASYNGSITGYSGSTAERYARKYGYKFVSLGTDPALTTTTTTTTKPFVTQTTTIKKRTTTSTTTTTTSTTAKSVTSALTSSVPVVSKTENVTVPITDVKASLHISDTIAYESDARLGIPQRVVLSVNGTDGLYCSTNIYVYYDKALKYVGAVPSSQISESLSTIKAEGDSGDFVFLSTAGNDDIGKDGDMWYVDLLLPSNAKKGDSYKVYVGQPKYKDRAPSLFTNFRDDAAGKALTAQIFSIKAEGTIKVAEDPPVVSGDMNGDGIIDGKDASMILAEYVSLSVGNGSVLDSVKLRAADVNGDGLISAVDASDVLSYYAYTSGGGKLSIKDYFKK